MRSSETYRAVTTLLAKMALPLLSKSLLGGFHLPDAGIHALGHVVVSCALGTGNKQELELELSNLVRSPSDDSSVATLALDARGKTSLLGRPFVKGSHLDQVWPSETPGLMLLETNIGSGKAAVLSCEGRKKIPSGGMRVPLPGLRVTLLLGKTLLLSLPQFHFLPLLGRRKDSAEGGRLWLANLSRRRNHLGRRRLLKLHVECELELEVIRNNELKLLPNWRISCKLQPGGRYAVYTIVERQAKPGPFIWGFISKRPKVSLTVYLLLGMGKSRSFTPITLTKSLPLSPLSSVAISEARSSSAWEVATALLS